jgi:hypothetical protein
MTIPFRIAIIPLVLALECYLALLNAFLLALLYPILKYVLLMLLKLILKYVLLKLLSLSLKYALNAIFMIYR